jgi:hypothetical protein
MYNVIGRFLASGGKTIDLARCATNTCSWAKAAPGARD